MKALTIWQPWAWAIVSGPKDVENRTWKPEGLVVGELFAIHAATRQVDPVVLQILKREHGCSPPNRFARGAVVGVCVYGGLLRSEAVRRGWLEAGYVGWFLTCRRALADPVICPGRQGLWQLPLNIEAAVVAQLGMRAR